MFEDNPKLYVVMVLGGLVAILASMAIGEYFEIEKARIEASKPCKCVEEKK